MLVLRLDHVVGGLTAQLQSARSTQLLAGHRLHLSLSFGTACRRDDGRAGRSVTGPGSSSRRSAMAAEDERSALLGALESVRTHLLDVVLSLDETDLRRPMLPSG